MRGSTGDCAHWPRRAWASGPSPSTPTRPFLIISGREAWPCDTARHAPGAAVTMNLGYTAGKITLTISNPVPGIASDHGEDGSGYGLAGMRERLQLTGGTLTAGRVDGQWMVRAQVLP